MRDTWVQSLGWEDPPGEGKDYPLLYSDQDQSMGCIVWGRNGSDMTEQLSLSLSLRLVLYKGRGFACFCSSLSYP